MTPANKVLHDGRLVGNVVVEVSILDYRYVAVVHVDNVLSVLVWLALPEFREILLLILLLGILNHSFSFTLDDFIS